MSRPRLTALLDAAKSAAVVIVSAPAGTGKTAAVADWARGKDPATVGWITFEDGDTQFWPYALQSLRDLGVQVPAGERALPDGGLDTACLTSVTASVSAVPERLILVVDGFEIASPALARDLDSLVRRSGGRLQLVLLARVDPVLPLYRYRLNATLGEVRAPDLAFTDDEASRLLVAAGTDLDERRVHDLNRRLRGWAAGLRFAGRALAGQDDPVAYVETVVEHTSDINEYLVREVLDAQPPEVRRFLLDTSVADTVSMDLAELLGGPAAVKTMYDLMSSRAFVEPVPGQPGCFHYYPFFRALLRAHLVHEAPERARRLTTVVSQWLREQGLALESLERLSRAGAWEEFAVEVVEEELIGALLLEDEHGALRLLARGLPATLHGPAAATVRAALAAVQGETHRCLEELDVATGGPGTLAPLYGLAVSLISSFAQCLTADAATVHRLAAEAYQVTGGALAGVAHHAEGGRGPADQARAVEYVRGVASLRSGRLDDAGAAFLRSLEQAPPSVSLAHRADCWGRVAIAYALQGRLSQAAACAEESLAKLARPGASTVKRPPTAHVALALVGMARCDPDLAWLHVRMARANPRLRDDAVCGGLIELVTATLEHDEGSHRTAHDRVETAAVAAGARDPWIADRLWVAAARMAVREGDHARAALALARVTEQGRPDVRLVATLAQVAGQPPLALDAPEDVTPRTDVCLAVADLLRTALEAREPERRAALSAALDLAADERLRRPFRDGGQAVATLVASQPDLMSEHLWVLTGNGPELVCPDRAASVAHGSGQRLIEPLTAKELEVLGHLAELLTTEEIAQKMFVSVNTVRTHIRHILRKLGVNRRNAAIRQARELGLLAA